MGSVRPLKTAVALGDVDDTSLALPSVNHYRSGIERVLEQVKSIKRTKSRRLSNTSASTSVPPTSPVDDSVFFDDLKSPSSPLSGSIFFRNGLSRSLGQERTFNRHITNQKSDSVKRNTVVTKHQNERSHPAGGTLGLRVSNASRSEPNLGRHLLLPNDFVTPNNVFSNKSTHRTVMSTRRFVKTRSAQPQPVRAVNGHVNTTKSQLVSTRKEASKMSVKRSADEPLGQVKGDLGLNGNSKLADITIKEAVDYLSREEETYQQCGASFIQHSTFLEDQAKDEVFKLNGILPLVSLLSSPASYVCQTASAALRNLSFKNNRNKEQIERCGGITKAVTALRDSDCAETQKQLTGLLWNLSSVDSLKPDLLKSALPVLMECVILPYTRSPDQTDGNRLDPEVFFHATGCLRNLSSAKQSNRQTLRMCRGLVDSLVSYVKDCVDEGKPDDKSAENCMCILHNLTFQLEAEAPALFSRIMALAKPEHRTLGDTGPINCFSAQSKDLDREIDFPIVEDRHPTGASWLFHSTTLQCYLDLLGSSQREETLEACCGALQNLTTHQGIVSRVMSQTIVQKLNGMKVIEPLLKSGKANVQKNTMALVGNLAKNPQVQNTLARKTLPELASILTASTAEGNESDDTLAMACQTANCLFMKEPEASKHLLTNKLINSLSRLSQNRYFPKASKAAALLLHNVWSEKQLQSFLKKQGMNKSSFVNDITTAAHKSVQVVD
ncbi:plakophilin-1 isoform X2 [Thalassophryne amazonica]|uniref:plakophilin-1 isoform X2 n=1 Tax=Thalassophryne amazonica TaxID=390379 RepID=UPI001471A883|nr:plakophilin-1 isoform X2 [Thalassophryne amazonica]